MNADVKFYDADYEPVADAKSAVRFGFRCPKRGTECTGLLIAGRTKLKRDGQGKNGGAPQWDLIDATPGRETFKPSINCGGCWHGYIREGKCVDA